jgi:hypothetical protein
VGSFDTEEVREMYENDDDGRMLPWGRPADETVVTMMKLPAGDCASHRGDVVRDFLDHNRIMGGEDGPGGWLCALEFAHDFDCPAATWGEPYCRCAVDVSIIAVPAGRYDLGRELTVAEDHAWPTAAGRSMILLSRPRPMTTDPRGPRQARPPLVDGVECPHEDIVIVKQPYRVGEADDRFHYRFQCRCGLVSPTFLPSGLLWETTMRDAPECDHATWRTAMLSRWDHRHG